MFSKKGLPLSAFNTNKLSKNLTFFFVFYAALYNLFFSSLFTSIFSPLFLSAFVSDRSSEKIFFIYYRFSFT